VEIQRAYEDKVAKEHLEPNYNYTYTPPNQKYYADVNIANSPNIAGSHSPVMNIPSSIENDQYERDYNYNLNKSPNQYQKFPLDNYFVDDLPSVSQSHVSSYSKDKKDRKKGGNDLYDRYADTAF
jgi:hypothetical protein